MIINITYFVQELYLPINARNQAEVEKAIEKHEPVILKKLLGIELYGLLKAYVDGGELPVEQRFKDLLDGKIYEISGTKYEWVGLRSKYHSVIANYVYFQYRKRSETYTMTVSEVKGKTENSHTVSGFDKMIDSWRRMYDIYFAAYHFLSNSTEYPEWVFTSIENKSRMIYL